MSASLLRSSLARLKCCAKLHRPPALKTVGQWMAFFLPSLLLLPTSFVWWAESSPAMLSPVEVEETCWSGLGTVTPDLPPGVVPERRGQNRARCQRADNQRGRAIACQLRSVPGLCFVCLYKHELSVASESCAVTTSQGSELVNCH